MRFFDTSQRGPSGVRNSRKKNAAAGKASTPNIHCHSVLPNWSSPIT